MAAINQLILTYERPFPPPLREKTLLELGGAEEYKFSKTLQGYIEFLVYQLPKVELDRPQYFATPDQITKWIRLAGLVQGFFRMRDVTSMRLWLDANIYHRVSAVNYLDNPMSDYDRRLLREPGLLLVDWTDDINWTFDHFHFYPVTRDFAHALYDLGSFHLALRTRHGYLYAGIYAAHEGDPQQVSDVFRFRPT